MVSKIVLDTNVWVSFLNEDENTHEKSVEIINSFANIIIPDFILQETLTVLKIKSNLSLASRFYELVKSNDNVKIEDISLNDDIFYSEFFKKENLKLSYIDSSLLALHKTKKYKVITFDKNLEKLLKKKFN